MDEKTRKTVTVLGGAMVPVTFRDGTTAEIKVIELPVRKAVESFKEDLEEWERVALYCEKSQGWVDQLTNQSYEDIIKVGSELNRPILHGYLTREGKENEQLAMVLNKMTAKMGEHPFGQLVSMLVSSLGSRLTPSSTPTLSSELSSSSKETPPDKQVGN
ncbi:MAG: hypothetical protein JW739_05655 [Opitutales bacterium]|nr:hypothetical protein [Opitutales bacterium]